MHKVMAVSQVTSSVGNETRWNIGLTSAVGGGMEGAVKKAGPSKWASSVYRKVRLSELGRVGSIRRACQRAVR